jgi:hypothetical protein
MKFKSPMWHPVALLLSGLNLVGVGFAAGAAEPMHAGIHGVLALAFWSWAQRLRQSPGEGSRLSRFDALELEVGELRRELGEAQERLDFTERMLAQGLEARRVEVERASRTPPG